MVMESAAWVIPGDGEVIEVIASVVVSAITGESAPVVREAGGDFSSVTGGTTVVSDWLKVRITSDPGDSFLDRMIALVEGASRKKTPNEIALNTLLVSLTVIFLIVIVTLYPIALYSGVQLQTSTLIALMVCLIPTTIGGLLSAIGIAGIDTRALTKILREKGTMNGMITTNENYHLDEIIPKLKAYNTGKVVEKVTCSEKSVLKGEGFKVALLDLGAKNNIARSLNERGCEVTIYPALTTAEEILTANPDGIMLSNGPRDPKECVSIIKEIKKLYDSNVPIFAICLGHQLMALATGADTHKMKYGHRGGNHPVKDLATGRVYISSQNHGYVVDTDTLDPNVAVPAFVNVNDGTNEGLKYVGKNIFTVQFHPEACPGPQDSGYLFDRFLEMMGGNK